MSKGKIIVVDDEAVMRDSLSQWLQQEGYDVLTFNTLNFVPRNLPRMAPSAFSSTSKTAVSASSTAVEQGRRFNAFNYPTDKNLDRLGQGVYFIRVDSGKNALGLNKLIKINRTRD